jgi:hypothetical protein
MTTLQVVTKTPEQSPPQPTKVEPLVGMAVRVTVATERYSPVHVAPQEIFPSEEVTFPVPPVWLSTSTFNGVFTRIVDCGHDSRKAISTIQTPKV